MWFLHLCLFNGQRRSIECLLCVVNNESDRWQRWTLYLWDPRANKKRPLNIDFRFFFSFSPRAAAEVLAALLKSSKHLFKKGVCVCVCVCVCISSRSYFYDRYSFVPWLHSDLWRNSRVSSLFAKENLVTVEKREDISPCGHVHL